MEAIKNYLKNRTIWYFIVALDALLALITAIVFFATYKASMPNNAWANAPETIGIYLLAGFAIELVVLALPQYKVIHVGAIIMFGLSLYKEIIIIPNLIADWINNVAFQGGSLPTNVFYIVMQFVIIISGIVVAFHSLYRDETEEAEDFKKVKGTTQITKLAVCGVVVLAAVLSSTIVSADIQRKAVVGSGQVAEGWTPITNDIKKIAEEYEYSFNPKEVLIKEKAAEDYDYNDSTLKSLPTGSNASREDVNLVYYFEGSYAEGYQGDYSETYGYLFLWEDGMFAGKIRDTQIRGYWYNSSISEGHDAEGNDIVDCLNMISNVDRYESIITEKADGFYDRRAYAYLDMGWGQRSIILSGYKYYPPVALAIDAGTEGKTPTYHVGETFSTDSWGALRILKDLSYSSVFKASEVKWTLPSELKNNAKLEETGEFEVKASWNGLEATITVVVLAD